jgi:hypothetical protein
MFEPVAPESRGPFEVWVVRVVWFATRLGELLGFILTLGEHCLHTVHFAVVRLGLGVLAQCRQSKGQDEAEHACKQSSERLLRHISSYATLEIQVFHPQITQIDYDE